MKIWLRVEIELDGITVANWSVFRAQPDLFEASDGFVACSWARKPRTRDEAGWLGWCRRHVKVPGHRIYWRSVSSYRTAGPVLTLVVPCIGLTAGTG